MSSSDEGVSVGAHLVLDVGPVAHGGHCVARHLGQVVFVRHTLPGEQVRALVTEIGPGGKFLRADAIEVLRAAAGRVPAPCPWAGPGLCGGCDWQHADLATQRELKAAVVVEQFSRLARLDLVAHLGRPVPVEPVPGDQDGLGWRTRVEFAVDEGSRPGLRRHRSHDIVPVEDCLIADGRVIGTGVLGRSYPGAAAVDVIAPSVGDPVIVEVLGEVTTDAPAGSEHALGDRAPRDRARKDRAPRTRTALPVPDVRERVVVSGGDLELGVSARGFWQVHPGAATTFVSTVLDWLQPRAGEHAVDLYAGVGLFAAALADRVGTTGSVLAIESDRVATDNARDNLAQRPWVQVRRDRVDRAVRGLLRSEQEIDLVVLDPPRTGAGRQVCRDIAGLHPRSIGYVACDPAALARDVGYLRDYGYRVRDLRAFDAFPMTHHMELVAVLDPA